MGSLYHPTDFELVNLTGLFNISNLIVLFQDIQDDPRNTRVGRDQVVVVELEIAGLQLHVLVSPRGTYYLLAHHTDIGYETRTLIAFLLFLLPFLFGLDGLGLRLLGLLTQRVVPRAELRGVELAVEASIVTLIVLFHELIVVLWLVLLAEGLFRL